MVQDDQYAMEDEDDGEEAINDNNDNDIMEEEAFAV